MVRSRKKKQRMTMGRFILLVSIATLAAAAFLYSFGKSFLSSEIPEVAVLRTQYPVVRYQGPKNPPVVTLQRTRPSGWVSLSQISKPAVGAVVVSEDWAFYQHKGYDPAQIKEAIKVDLERGHFKRGASTITQQVVKNVFLERDKTLWRKLKEIYLAVRLEETVGKNKILETYLNIAELGEGIFGIRQAAQFYFSKSPSELTAKEGAFLAMLLPSPKRYSQSFRAKRLTRYAYKTVSNILAKMTQAHFISDEERLQSEQNALSFEVVPALDPSRLEGGEESGSDDSDAEFER